MSKAKNPISYFTTCGNQVKDHEKINQDENNKERDLVVMKEITQLNANHIKNCTKSSGYFRVLPNQLKDFIKSN